MMSRSLTLAALVLASSLLAACGGSRSNPTPREAPTATAASSTAASSTTASSTSASSTTASSTTASDHGGAATPVAAASAPSDLGPAPQLAIRGIPQRAGRAVDLVVENRGEHLARIGPRLTLERAGDDGRFTAIDSVRLAMRPDCEHAAPECIELAPGAAYYPPAWLGTTGDAQCACERCAPAEPGVYRVVATSCGGAHRLEGEPFELGTR